MSDEASWKEAPQMTHKHFLKIGALVSALFLHSVCLYAQEEDWKGKPDPQEFTVGVLTGMGIVDSKAGLSVLGTVSRKVVEPGFAPDINNGVSIELAAGPLFASGETTLFYSTHLRWDFRKTAEWGLYALGGLAGYTANSQIGNPFEFFPRFGIGTFWRLQDTFWLRAEVSHEFTGVGLNLAF